MVHNFKLSLYDSGCRKNFDAEIRHIFRCNAPRFFASILIIDTSYVSCRNIEWGKLEIREAIKEEMGTEREGRITSFQ